MATILLLVELFLVIDLLIRVNNRVMLEKLSTSVNLTVTGS